MAARMAPSVAALSAFPKLTTKFPVIGLAGSHFPSLSRISRPFSDPTW